METQYDNDKTSFGPEMDIGGGIMATKGKQCVKCPQKRCNKCPGLGEADCESC